MYCAYTTIDRIYQSSLILIIDIHECKNTIFSVVNVVLIIKKYLVTCQASH